MVRTKRKRVKKRNLKKELDSVFSTWVRLGATHCYTCGKASDKLQCGHFVSRTYLATRWEPDNCRPQCVGCNIFGAGKPLDFEERLVQELGEKRVSELKQMRKQVLKLKPAWYEAQIAYYTTLCENKLSQNTIRTS